MKHPADQDIGPKAILRVNAKLVLAVIVLFYGWVVWQMASIDFWGFYLLGPMALMAGGIMAWSGLWKAGELILARRRFKRFQTLGADPRADSMADDEAFTRGGPDQ